MLQNNSYKNCYCCLAAEAVLTSLSDMKDEIHQSLLICVPELKWEGSYTFCSECVKQLESLNEFRQKCLTNRNNQLIIKTEEHCISDTEEGTTNTGSIEIVKHEISEFCKQEECHEKIIEEIVYDEGTELAIQSNGQSTLYEQEDDQQKVIEETADIETKESKVTENTKSTNERKKKSKINKRIKCNFCNVFFSGSQVADHIRAKHTFEKPFKCDLCNKSFPALGVLRTHRHSHSEQRKYFCTHCGEMFKYRTSLRVHILSKHEDPKNWKLVCSYCNKRFPIKRLLDIHVRTKHTGEKKFVCNGCSKSFYDASGLRRHNLLHSNERPFKCDLCPKDYKRNYDVKYHKKKVHNIDLFYNRE